MFGLLLPLLLSHPAGATDVYSAELSDGSISFTDSPQHTGFALLFSDKPMPEPSKATVRNFPMRDAWDEEILDASRRYGVPAELIKAVMMTESGMNPEARSRSGAMGLMQLIPSTAKAMGVDDAWDPIQNIDGGAHYLKLQIDRFGDMRRAVAAYNAGPRNVEKFGGIPPFEETQLYVPRVLALYDMFRGAGLLQKMELTVLTPPPALDGPPPETGLE